MCVWMVYMGIVTDVNVVRKTCGGVRQKIAEPLIQGTSTTSTYKVKKFQMLQLELIKDKLKCCFSGTF